MKRTILFAMICLSALRVWAQEPTNKKMVDENNVWTYCGVGYNLWAKEHPICNLSFTKYYFKGDTIIEGKTYKKLWEQRISHRNNTSSYIPEAWHIIDGMDKSEPRYCLGVREENGQVFVNTNEYVIWALIEGGEDRIFPLLEEMHILKQTGNECILYDFNEEKQEGTIPYVGNINYIFYRRGEVPEDNISRHSFLNLFYRGDQQEYISPQFMSDPFFPEVIDPKFSHPLVEEGKRWTYDNYMDGRSDEYDFYYWYYLEGDTVINGKTCLKMYSENEYNDGKVSYKGALYEEDKKVFYVNNDGKLALLYDFNCKVGDEITVPQGTLRVNRIYINNNQGRDIRIYELLPLEYEDYESPIYTHWIEGVGCTSGFFSMIIYPGDNNSLDHCEVQGEVLYQYVQPKYTEDGYHEMAIEGKTWNYIHHYEDEKGIHEEPYSYVVKGDTLIGRTIYKKLYYKDANSERFAYTLSESGREFRTLSPGSIAWDPHYTFGRTDIGRVFDWTSKQGKGQVYWMLHKIDTITVNDTDFRRLEFFSKTIKSGTPGMLKTIEDGPDVWHEIWVEGVGSELTGIEYPVHEKPMNDKDYTRFVSCYENGKCIFTSQDFTTTAPPFRRFVEDGKKWEVGLFSRDNYDYEDVHEAQAIEHFYFDGDTIVGDQPCKKMMCRSEYNDVLLQGGRYKPQTVYVGALYEKNRHVYMAYPKSQEFFLIYDFATPEDTIIDFYDTIIKQHSACYINTKWKSDSDTFHGTIIDVGWSNLGDYMESLALWREGVGYMCIYNYQLEYQPLNRGLLSCTVDDEVLYYDASMTVDPTLIDPSEVKKHWLDFTHTTKPRPKSPGKKEGPSPSPSPTLPVGAREPVGAKDKADSEEEMVTGEYSAKELFVNLKTLTGPYVVTLTDDNGKEVYRKEVQTSNIVALNTDLTKYADGTYTLVVENSEEQYTATLALPLIDDAVRDLPTALNSNPSTLNSWYDLSGRQLTTPPTQKGVYIREGRKVLVK